MTTQEAIKTLKDVKLGLDCSEFSFYADEALDMAIEALSDDCQGILTPEERSEVLNTIDDALNGYQVDGYEDTDGMFFKVLISKKQNESELDNNSTKVDNKNDELNCSESPNRSEKSTTRIYLNDVIDTIYMSAKLENRIEADEYADMFVCAIKALPPAQPERKKGEWVNARDGYDGHVKCNKCFKTYDWTSDAQYFNFCPNCGADMRGEQK